MEGVFEARWARLHDDCMVLAWALNPMNLAPDLNDYEQECCLKSLKELLDPAAARLALGQFTRFMGKTAEFGSLVFSKECVESSGGGVAWWKAWGKNAPELMSVAVALLSLPGTSGACERNWSVHDLIQSDLRTLLDPGRLRKLVYIYFNPCIC